MNERYAGSTIRQPLIAMGAMFKSALMNDLIPKHPMDGVRFTKPVKVETGVSFKFLSTLFGHSSVKTNLDRYAHTTNDSMLHAVQQFETKMKKIMA